MSETIEPQLACSAPLDELAARIAAAGLTVPAIFFLELYKPLGGLTHLMLEAGMPLIEPLCGIKLLRQAAHVLQSRDQMEALIVRLEALSAAASRGKEAGSAP